MEQEEFSDFLISKDTENVKSCSNTSKKMKGHVEDKTTTNNFATKEPLTAKKAVELLLQGSLKSKVCRYCLNISSLLYELDQVFQIGGQGSLYKVTVRDMIASFYPFKVIEDVNFPNRICDKCLDTTISSYLFTQQCERSGRALRNCFDDMYEKLDKLDPVDRPKKRGRQKLNPNYNTLYSEHEKVIDYADPIIHLKNVGVELTEDNKNEINKLECPKCSEILPNIESLLNHETIHPKHMWFNCRLCGKSFPKRNLYRKHIKTDHMHLKQLPSQDTGFKCTDCGVINEVYDQHLQHIEKHKFHMIMQHLIERRMDKLCVVCLDKGVKMVDMDKVIRFHGGCPELTGQRSLYNILGSTMPEQNSYKYQELLLPYKANILELVKKRKSNTLLESEEATLNNVEEFPLSNPIMVSDLVINCDNYIFLFTKPQKVNEILTVEKSFAPEDTLMEKTVANESTEKCIEKDMVQEIEISDNPTDNDIKNTTQDNPYTTSDQYVYTFTKPELNVEMLLEHETEITVACDTGSSVVEKLNNESKVVKTCKTCWIFKNSSFKTCLETTKVSNDRDKISDDELGATDEIAALDSSLSQVGSKMVSILNNDCKYCWIFQYTEKCNYCKKEFNVPEPVDDVFVANNTDIAKQKDIVIYNIKKRKTTPNLDCPSKKTKWQCNICLTENANNELCVCCDSRKYNDQCQVKFQFGLNSHLLLNNDINREPVAVKAEKQLNDNSIITSLNGLEDHQSNIITNENKERTMKLTLHGHGDKTQDIATVVPQFTIMENNDVVTMDTGIDNIIQNCNEYVTQCIPQEQMDIEENFTSEQPCNISTAKPSLNFTHTAESNFNFISTTTANLNFASNLQERVPNFESVVKPNIQASTFNFNIGMGPIDDRKKSGRRIKRPLRRIATTFPK